MHTRHASEDKADLGKGASVVLLFSFAKVKVSFPRGKQVNTLPSLLTATPYIARVSIAYRPVPHHLTHGGPEVEVCMNKLDRWPKSTGVKVDLCLRESRIIIRLIRRQQGDAVRDGLVRRRSQRRWILRELQNEDVVSPHASQQDELLTSKTLEVS